VRVKVDGGSVRVMTSDTKQVEFRVRSEGFTAINIGGNVSVDSQQNGNEVQLTVRQSPGFVVLNTKRLITEVRMPTNGDLQLESGDGRAELADLNGNIIVRTSDGAIRVSRLSGSIDLQSNNGDITADALGGTFKLQSKDGKISGTALDGKCEISTKNGGVHVAGRFDILDVKSRDGAVTARAGAGSKLASAWSVDTKQGRVDVDIPKDLQANLDASTGDGHISLDLPAASIHGDIGNKAVHGAINGGGPLLYIHTGDGSIRLKAL
jgi:DUF4097 and DUF4098 domain-containing protein YvlB